MAELAMRSSRSKIYRGRNAALAAAAFAVLGARSAHAQENVFSGRAFTDFYLPMLDSTANTMRQSSASFWLEAQPKLGERSQASVVLLANVFDTSVNQTSTAPRLETSVREANASYVNAGFELRMGKMIVPWGKTDGVNPTDVLTAKDYSFLNPDDEVRRLGHTSLLVQWTPKGGVSPLTLTGVFTPVAPQTKLLLNSASMPSAGGGYSFSTTAVAPSFTWDNAELAARAALAFSGWDMSVMAFRGRNHFPEFEISGTVIQPTYHRLSVVGGDFSFNVGKWVFRGEAAYLMTENADGTNPLIQPPRVDVVIGIERPIGDDFRVQVQGLARYHTRFQAPSTFIGSDVATTIVGRQVAATNALLLNYQEQWRPGATFRLGYSRESAGVDADLFLTGYLVGGDYLVRPRFTYAWTDALKSTLGVDYYGGPRDRPLGQLWAFNSVFVEMKYTF